MASESVISHFFLDFFLDLDFRYDYQVGRESGHSANFDSMEKSINECFFIHYVTSDINLGIMYH